MPTPIDQKYKHLTIEVSIKWYGAWRSYAFFPMNETLYDHHCLWDIADFVARETSDLRETWKKKKTPAK